MKAIIEGKRYNTASATRVAGLGYGNDGDFHSWGAGLYVTAKGAWFLAGWGGAYSRWGRTEGGNSYGGDGIIPILEDEAQDLLEREGDGDAIEDYFGAQVLDA